VSMQQCSVAVSSHSRRPSPLCWIAGSAFIIISSTQQRDIVAHSAGILHAAAGNGDTRSSRALEAVRLDGTVTVLGAVQPHS
jgi:hypothetical protein